MLFVACCVFSNDLVVEGGSEVRTYVCIQGCVWFVEVALVIVIIIIIIIIIINVKIPYSI